jgi:hypothetical protein
MIQTWIRTTDRDSGAGLLLQTQETYLDLAGNALASAERLRLHRTSLYYRIRHMTELTYTDLKDGGEVSASTWNSSWSGSAAITSGRVTTAAPATRERQPPRRSFVRYRAPHFDICPMTSACVIFTVYPGANHAHGQEAQ